MKALDLTQNITVCCKLSILPIDEGFEACFSVNLEPKSKQILIEVSCKGLARREMYLFLNPKRMFPFLNVIFGDSLSLMVSKRLGCPARTSVRSQSERK
ncbi:hypothetical protein Trydic_g5011 [Trypoxylus dichotomus]